MSVDELTEQLLNDRTYHIEFNGHLTNHVKQAVVALAGLGAPEQRIKDYYDGYVKLTPYGFGLEPARTPRRTISTAEWESLLGKRIDYPAYCEFFEREVTRLGLREVLQRYVPRLLPGWVGSFTHAAIHLGWALDARNLWMAVEGLAYLAFSYQSCHPERATADTVQDERPVDSLLRVAGVWEENHDTLHDWARALAADIEAGLASGIHPELARSGLQFRIARMADEGHPLIYQTPAWIDRQDPHTSWQQLYYVATLLYLAVPGDFILLHLITSLHGVEQIAIHLSEEDQREAIRCFWLGMLCIVFSGAEFPTRTKLAALHAEFDGAIDAGKPAVWQPDWKQLIARALVEDEEHNPKLVYTLRRFWMATGGRTIYRAAAGQFTATPELPPSFDEAPTE